MSKCLWTSIVKSCHRFSVKFRIALLLHFSQIWRCFKLFICNSSYMLVVVVMLEGKPPPKFISASNRFSSRIVLYLASSMLWLTLTSFCSHTKQKYFNGMMQSPQFSFFFSTNCVNRTFNFDLFWPEHFLPRVTNVAYMASSKLLMKVFNALININLLLISIH